MAAGNVAKIIKTPGKLLLNPTTDFSATFFPFGGTQIGLSQGCAWQSFGEPFRVYAEGLGQFTDELEPEKVFGFACTIRYWDKDAVRLLRPEGYTEGATTQHALYSEPGTVTPGQSRTSHVKLVYVPDDQANANGVILYNALPYWTPAAEVAFNRQTDQEMPLVFTAYANSSNNILRIGRIPDFSLT